MQNLDGWESPQLFWTLESWKTSWPVPFGVGKTWDTDLGRHRIRIAFWSCDHLNPMAHTLFPPLALVKTPCHSSLTSRPYRNHRLIRGTKHLHCHQCCGRQQAYPSGTSQRLHGITPHHLGGQKVVGFLLVGSQERCKTFRRSLA